MKKLMFLIVFALMTVVSLTGCVAEEHVAVPTHFVCYQDGKIVVDVKAIDQPVLGYVKIPGDIYPLAWIWTDENGLQGFLTKSDSVSCQSSPVGE